MVTVKEELPLFNQKVINIHKLALLPFCRPLIYEASLHGYSAGISGRECKALYTVAVFSISASEELWHSASVGCFQHQAKLHMGHPLLFICPALALHTQETSGLTELKMCIAYTMQSTSQGVLGFTPHIRILSICCMILSYTELLLSLCSDIENR